jgi:hypothetical protein
MGGISWSGLVLIPAFIISKTFLSSSTRRNEIRKKRIGITRRLQHFYFFGIVFLYHGTGKSLGPQDEFGWQIPNVLVNFVES